MSKTINARRRRTSETYDPFVVQGYQDYNQTGGYGNSETSTDSLKASILLFKETIETDPDATVKLTPSGISYYEQLPEGSERCKVYTQFYRLVNGAKHWKQDNIELRVGMYFLIYSPVSERFYLRQVHEFLNVEKLKQYIRDKNLYLINKDQS